MRLRIQKRFLVFPVNHSTAYKRLRLTEDGKELYAINIKLDSIAIEKVSVIKACQLIPLCPAKDIPVFRKLNGAQHTGKNNLLP